MKKVIIGTVLLLTTTLSAFSQTKNITVAGRVIEDDTERARSTSHSTVTFVTGQCICGGYSHYSAGIFHPAQSARPGNMY